MVYYEVVVYNHWQHHSFFSRTGTENMMLSAIYPDLFGEVIAKVHQWLTTSCLRPVMDLYVCELAESMPSAEESLRAAKQYCETYKWKDVDPGFQGVENMLAPPLPKAEVRLALCKRRLALQSAKKPFPVSESEDEGGLRSPSSGPGGTNCPFVAYDSLTFLGGIRWFERATSYFLGGICYRLTSIRTDRQK